MGRGTGKGWGRELAGPCICCLVLTGAIIGVSFGIAAVVDKWETQEEHQSWPKVAGQCTITGRAGTDTYECNCQGSGETRFCDTCTFTDQVYVTSSTFSSTRKASW